MQSFSARTVSALAFRLGKYPRNYTAVQIVETKRSFLFASGNVNPRSLTESVRNDRSILAFCSKRETWNNENSSSEGRLRKVSWIISTCIRVFFNFGATADITMRSCLICTGKRDAKP